jgi:hypothetical protein
MSSGNGNGVLSKQELAAALRLIGWVQAGDMLSEKLLAVGMLSGYDARQCILF